MIESPTARLSVTEQDQEKIRLVQERLKVVQDEVLDATKLAAELEKKARLLDEEISYKQVLITILDAELEKKTVQAHAMDAHLETAQKSLLETESRVTHHEKVHETRSAEVSERLLQVSQREQSHADAAHALTTERDALAEERAKIDSLKKAFLEVAALV